MTTFEEFITKPISRKVALLEAEPGLELTEWTQDSGNIYYADFNETLLNAPAIISRVLENSAALTKKTSQGEMVQGSWYQDVSAGRLYVWCSDDGNPSAKVIIAYFEVYFGTEGRVFNDHFYQPRIPERGVSLTAADDQVDGGEMVLLNGDGWFDERMTRWLWRGARAKLLLGGDDLPYADYEKICNLRIEAVDLSDQEARLSLKGVKLDWNRRLPLSEFYTLTETLRPNANGTHTAWEGDYQDVDEADEPQGDRWASYIKTSAGGTPKESYAIPDSSVPDDAEVNFVALYMVGRVKLNDDHRIRFLIRTHGNDYTAGGEAPHWPWHSWEKKVQVWSVNPYTGSGWTKDEINALEIGVEGDIKVAGQELYVTQIYLVVNYSVMRAFDEGRPLPILYGEGEFTPVLIDNSYKKGKYGLADSTVQTLKAIDWVKYEGAEIPADKLEKNLTDCWFAIENNWSGTVEDPANVKAMVKGAKRSDIPGESSTDMITCASDILRHLVQVVLGYDASMMDTTSFDAARSADQKNRAFIVKEDYAGNIIARLCQTVRGILGQDREGKIYFKLWDIDASSAIKLRDEDLLEFRAEERRGAVCQRAVAKYGQDPDTGDWLLVATEDSSVSHKYPLVETKAFETTMVDKGDALSLAFDYLAAYKEPMVDYEIVVKLQASKLKVGDKIKLTRKRAPGGSFSEEVLQVKSISREGNRTRLMLEPNLYLGFQLISSEGRTTVDTQEGINRALAVFDKENQQVKKAKVLAESIKQDEALRKDSISMVQIAANSAKAVAHGQSVPVHFVVAMYSSGEQNIYELRSFNYGLRRFLTDWDVVIYSTGTMPHLETDGDMEAADTNAWTPANDAILSKVTSPVHGGNRALKIEIGAGKTYGNAYQEIDVTPGPSGSADVFSWRVWARNGNAANVKLYAYYYDGDWHELASAESIDTTQYVELKLLRKSVPVGTTKLRIYLQVNGSAGQYGYFDDAKVSYPDSSIVIKQINGTTKDFKVRAFLEQAGS